VFARLDPAACRACCPAWVRAVTGAAVAAGAVAIDGQAARRSHDRGRGQAALRPVSARATARGRVPGQVATGEESNESPAIPALPRRLDLEGCTVTIDATGGQTASAAPVVDRRAAYVLALEATHPPLREQARLAFADARATAGPAPAPADLDAARTVDKGHGRRDIRHRRAFGDPAYLADPDPAGARPHRRRVVLVEAERRVGDAVSVEARSYRSGLPPAAAARGQASRRHREVENRVHRAPDVVFRADDSRARTGHAPQDLAILRHLALNRLRRDPARGSRATERLRAALDTTYLRSILTGSGS
jgi:predicted transposase YbfD/YdcC